MPENDGTERDGASLPANPFEHLDVDWSDPLWNVQWFDTGFWPLVPES
jgi:hypothetical protein